MENNIINNLAKILSKMPGMGPRISKRIVLHLALNKDKVLSPLIQSLNNLKDNVRECAVCGNIDSGDICSICRDLKRDGSVICIVEEVSDLWAIERSESYFGKYHVLGGRLSALQGTMIEDLNIKSLHERLSKDDSIKELVIATSATIDGQTTAHFITDNFKNYKLKITRLTYGIPMGSELDYLDEGTINVAFKTRSEF